MAIGIYTKPHEDFQLSENSTRTNPLNIAINGRDGGVIYFKLYIRNNSLIHWYSNIQLSIISSDNSLIDDSKGFSWKIIESDNKPTVNEWNNIVAGSGFTFDEDIGSSNSADAHIYIPFWLRVEIPGNEPAHQVKHISLQLNYEENLID
jgi:hypothetical protein